MERAGFSLYEPERTSPTEVSSGVRGVSVGLPRASRRDSRLSDAGDAPSEPRHGPWGRGRS
jgi:hypothetical protein